MKSILTSILTLFVISLATVFAQADVQPQFRCVGVEGKNIKFYTSVWSSGLTRMQVKYTDSYYGNGGNYEPDIDRAYSITRDGVKYIADVPGIGVDRLQLVIDTSTTGRMLKGGKEWGNRSRVHQATFQTGDGKPLPMTCELAFW